MIRVVVLTKCGDERYSKKVCCAASKRKLTSAFTHLRSTRRLEPSLPNLARNKVRAYSPYGVVQEALIAHATIAYKMFT